MKFAGLLFLILFAFTSFAQIGGTSTYKFLSLAPSARAAAQGGYLNSIKDDDLAAAYQNPSLLRASMHNTLTINNAFYYAGIKHGYLGYARHYDSIGTFSTGIQYIQYGYNMPRTDANGDIRGDFGAAEYALNMAYSKEQGPYSYGLQAKLIGSFLETYFSAGLLLDAGGTYFNPEKNFTASLLFKNMGRQIKAYFPGRREPMPFDIQIGMSKKLKHLPFRFSVTAHHLYSFDIRYDDPNAEEESSLFDSDTAEVKVKKHTIDKIFRHFTFGGELSLGKNLRIMAGYDHLRRQELTTAGRKGMTGFSFGAGVKIKRFDITYARSTYHVAGASHYLSIATSLSYFLKSD